MDTPPPPTHPAPHAPHAPRTARSRVVRLRFDPGDPSCRHQVLVDPPLGNPHLELPPGDCAFELTLPDGAVTRVWIRPVNAAGVAGPPRVAYVTASPEIQTAAPAPVGAVHASPDANAAVRVPLPVL